jgi:hypothetical protein
MIVIPLTVGKEVVYADGGEGFALVNFLPCSVALAAAKLP